MRKLWIVPAVFVTASMASAAYGGGAKPVNVTTQVNVGGPVTQVTVGSPVNQVNVVNQVATGITTVVQVPTSIALHGNAAAIANSAAATTVINKAIIKFGPSSAIGQ
ncbi:MAG: hypothetical protein ABSD90_16415 [Methylocystis sp.]|jgi:hypothetical protein